MKAMLTLVISLCLISCSSDADDDVAADIANDIQNEVDEATKDIVVPTAAQGRTQFVLRPVGGKTTIVQFKNIVACKMPTSDDPTMLLEAYETNDLDGASVKIEGPTSGAKLDIKFSDDLAFSFAKTKIVTDSESEPSFLATKVVGTQAYAMVGSYLCAQ